MMVSVFISFPQPGWVPVALFFYLITNTAARLFNPFGTRNTRGFLCWLTALTKGTAGWPETWQFQSELISY